MLKKWVRSYYIHIIAFAVLVAGSWVYFKPAVDIKYTVQSDQLNVEIMMPRLYARSVQESDKSDFEGLFGDPQVNGPLSYDTISVRDVDGILKDRWISKWKRHIPFSGFAVFDKKDKKFMGFMRIERTTNEPGQLEIAYALHKEYWGKGYGTEMIHALVHRYVPYLIQQGINVKGYPITEIVANCREDNKGSERVLEKNGFVFTGKILIKKYYSFKIR